MFDEIGNLRGRPQNIFRVWEKKISYIQPTGWLKNIVNQIPPLSGMKDDFFYTCALKSIYNTMSMSHFFSWPSESWSAFSEIIPLGKY